MCSDLWYSHDAKKLQEVAKEEETLTRSSLIELKIDIET